MTRSPIPLFGVITLGIDGYLTNDFVKAYAVKRQVKIHKKLILCVLHTIYIEQTDMIEIPKNVMIEMHHDAQEPDSCDVIVETERRKDLYNGLYYPALSTTTNAVGYTVGQQLADVPPVRYAVLETPHIVVENLKRDTIEDTIDNLTGARYI